jgi:5-methylcytosine-specific restriction endonuclease McrA
MALNSKPKQERRWYDTTRWRKASRRFLDANPLCVLCARIGRDTAATVVDHIELHRNDYEKFWSEDNWQGVCASCHSAAKRMQETHGYSQAADINGLPIDEQHPWNRGSIG